MKHKTLFRLLVKAIGVYFMAQGFIDFLSVFPGLFVMIRNLSQGSTSGGRASEFLWAMFGVLWQLPTIAVGLLLFFRPNWITNLAIPSNRPYCPECGYDLSRNAGEACPECGTALPATLSTGPTASSGRSSGNQT